MRRLLSFLSGSEWSSTWIDPGPAVTPYSGKELKMSLQDRIKILQNEMQAAYDERKNQLETELANLRHGHIILKE